MVMNYLEGITLDKYLNSMVGRFHLMRLLDYDASYGCVDQVHNVGIT